MDFQVFNWVVVRWIFIKCKLHRQIPTFQTSLEANTRLNQQNDLSLNLEIDTLPHAKVFYRIDSKKNVIMPNLGLTFESSNRDYHEGAFLDLSGGKTLFGQIGVDYFCRTYFNGLTLPASIYQDVAQGNIISNNRFSAQILYLFNFKINNLFKNKYIT